MKRIGIVIPYVNCEEYLTGAIGSIKTMYDFCLVLIDNGSRRQLSDIISLSTLPDDTVMIKHSKNMGVAAAWNEGIRRCFLEESIDAVVVLNNDIILHPEAIDLLVDELAKGKFPVVTGTDVAKKCSQPQDIFTIRRPEIAYVKDEPEFSCFVISREGYENIGDFDEKFYPAYFEDNDYHYRARLKKERLVKLNTALYYHFGSRSIRENADLDSVVNTFYLQNKRYFEQKWGGEPGHEKYKAPFNDRKYG